MSLPVSALFGLPNSNRPSSQIKLFPDISLSQRVTTRHVLNITAWADIQKVMNFAVTYFPFFIVLYQTGGVAPLGKQ